MTVDLTQLAVDRFAPTTGGRPRLLARYVLPGVLLAGFLALAAWASWETLFPEKPVTVVPVFATRATVQNEGAPLFKAAGWIEPRPTPVRVAALAPGFVEQLLVVEDQAVQAGEPIAELVKDDARLALDSALADVKLRQAELNESQATLTAAETRLAQPVHLEAALGEAEAALADVETILTNLPFETQRAKARLDFAQLNYEGKRTAEGTVSGRIIDSAKTELDAAQALVNELRGRADSLEKQRAALVNRRDALRTQLRLLADETQARDEAQAKVDAADARLEQSRVMVSEARLRLERMTVRAPIDGRVFRLIANPGTRLMAGPGHSSSHDGSTVVTMYRPDSLQVRVDVRFEDIPQVRLGQQVAIDNPALGEPLTGDVLFVSSEADIQKNTLQVKVGIPSPPPVLKPEMLVDVTFLAPRQSQPAASSEEMRLYLPEPLVHRDGDATYVWLADQSAGIVRKTVVETGVVSQGLVEITRGLNVSSRVVATGHEELRDGQRIRVTGEELDVAQASVEASARRALGTPPQAGRAKTLHRLHPGGGT